MPARLDLERSRDWRDLAYDSATIWLRHAPVFLLLAALAVVPVIALVWSLWDDVADGRGLAAASYVAYQALTGLVVPALVTAMHVVAVQDLGAGRRPRVLHSLAVSLRLAPVVIAVLLLYGVAVLLGLVALIAPGIYLAVALYFGPQAAVAEQRGAIDALRRSYALVAPDWGRVFLIGLFLVLATEAAATGLEALLGIVLGDDGVAGAARAAVGWSVALSLTARSATLLFFDLRARGAVD